MLRSVSFHVTHDSFSFDRINIALKFTKLKAMPFSLHDLCVRFASSDEYSLTNLISLPRRVIIESSANNDVFPVVFSNGKSLM